MICFTVTAKYAAESGCIFTEFLPQPNFFDYEQRATHNPACIYYQTGLNARHISIITFTALVILMISYFPLSCSFFVFYSQWVKSFPAGLLRCNEKFCYLLSLSFVWLSTTQYTHYQRIGLRKVGTAYKQGFFWRQQNRFPMPVKQNEE